MPRRQLASIVGHGVLRHPYFLAILEGKHGCFLHILEGSMAIEVASNDVDLLAALLVLHERVGIVLGEAQRLAADKPYAGIGLTVEHPAIVLDKLYQILRVIEATGIAHPPVGFVLDRHGIDFNIVGLHPLQEGVQPREELLVAILTQLAALVALVFSIATLSRAIGLVYTGRRPRSTKDDATAILHNLGRGERAIPVVVAPLVGLVFEVRRDFHAQDVQSYF